MGVPWREPCCPAYRGAKCGDPSAAERMSGSLVQRARLASPEQRGEDSRHGLPHAPADERCERSLSRGGQSGPSRSERVLQPSRDVGVLRNQLSRECEKGGHALEPHGIARLCKPVSTHVALVFAAGTDFRGLSVAVTLAEALKDIFSEEPVVLPPGAPPDFPRISITQEGTGQLAVRGRRADLELSWKDEPEWERTVAQTAGAMARCFIDGAALTVSRMGLAVAHELDESVEIGDLQRQYIRDGKMRDALELSLGWRTHIVLEDLHVSRLVKLSLRPRSGQKSTVSIDVNTLPEGMPNLGAARIEQLATKWMAHIRRDIDEILEWERCGL